MAACVLEVFGGLGAESVPDYVLGINRLARATAPRPSRPIYISSALAAYPPLVRRQGGRLQIHRHGCHAKGAVPI
jgi:hypothetical protein